jgi:NTP pyrophosphatase (non-canonical NTP hydrolase)
MIDIKVVQRDLYQWVKYNFPKSGSNHNLLGIGEELGELMDNIIIYEENKNDPAADLNDIIYNINDAVGDTMVFLMNFCSYNYIKIDEILMDIHNEFLDENTKIKYSDTIDVNKLQKIIYDNITIFEDDNTEVILQQMFKWYGYMQHVQLKTEQQIRGFDNPEYSQSQLKSSIKNFLKYFLTYTTKYSGNLSVVIEDVLKEIFARDWQINKKDGVCE